MTDTVSRPAPIPTPDRHQIDRLNRLWNIVDGAPQPAAGLGARLAAAARRTLGRVLSRQQEFNATVVDHINRNIEVAEQAHLASAEMIRWIAPAIDEVRRYQQALAARERRSEAAVAALASAHDELRASLGVLQQAGQTLKREVSRLMEHGVSHVSPADTDARPHPGTSAAASGQLAELDSHTYVGFEDQFRGSQEDIRRRVTEYLPVFEGAADVLDVGCGRGEFLALLRDQGIRARGIDINGAMIDVCREQGLEAQEADALGYLRVQPDASLGGLFAAQVIEHLEPRYLTALLDAAFQKLRPGAPIVLETINPACWFAFFESYIRDITHVRPIHPETLQYLLVASGFQRVEIRYRAPYPERDKLQPIAPNATLGDSVETLNANVERLNRLLFTWLDYAAIGRRP
jgi:O-antigen chain-terminating methyltransferase